MVDLAIALVDGSDARLLAPRLLRELKPTGLSDTARIAIKRVLSRGIARQVVEGGGPAPWRTAPPLRFGSATLDLLTWLYSVPVASADRKPLALRAAPTAAEGLLLSTATGWLSILGAPPPDVALQNPWVWLLSGANLATHASTSKNNTPTRLDWSDVTANGWLVDALAPRLKASLLSWNRISRASGVPETTAHGEAQEQLYGAFLNAVPVDRSLFIAQAIVDLAKLDLGVWEIARAEASVSQWQRARRARVGLIRVASVWLSRIETRARSIGFVDDGFEQAQRELRRFEDAFIAVRRLAPAIARAEELPI